MLSKKYFVISIMVILITNIIYGLTRIYHPSLLELELYSLPIETIPLVVNSLLITLVFFVFKPPQKISNLTESISRKKSTATYSDLTLINTLPHLFCIKDHKGHWMQANDEYLDILELQNIDYKGKTDAYLGLHSDSINRSLLEKNRLQANQAWEERITITNTDSYTNKNNENIPLELTTIPIFDDENQPFRLFIYGQTRLNPKKHNHQLELLNAIFSESHISSIILDKDLNIIDTNLKFTKLLQYSTHQVKNQSISCIISKKRRSNFHKKSQTYFEGNSFQCLSKEIKCQKADGDLIPTQLTIKPILNSNNTPTHYFVTIENISSHKRKARHLSRIAHYDPLTSLVNRVMFLDRMAQFLSSAKQHKLHAAVLFIDIDKFKSINETLGHKAGDQVLKEIAKRLLSVAEKQDIVARFSRDEFAIFLLNKKSYETALFSASLIAGNINRSLSKIISIGQQELFIGASIGIAIFPEDGTSSEQLLNNADLAMYQAKNKEQNSYQFYKSEYNLASQDHLELENNLRKAIDTHELQLFYQPQYHAKNKEISGAEVLIRWHHHESFNKTKIISPEQFIPIAEESGLILKIGAWILETACLQFKAWLDKGYKLPQISVNVSGRQFMDDSFMDCVDHALKQSNLKPEYLELEITESILIGDLNKIESQLKKLKAMGIKIALDDFGTGYSSLSYLKKLPIDILKIDQAFIKEVSTNSKDAGITTAIINMGHSLNQKIVAEGVENEAQLKFLCKNNCDFIQGYYFSKPLPVHKMTELLKEELRSLEDSDFIPLQ